MTEEILEYFSKFSYCILSWEFWYLTNKWWRMRLFLVKKISTILLSLSSSKSRSKGSNSMSPCFFSFSSCFCRLPNSNILSLVEISRWFSVPMPCSMLLFYSCPRSLCFRTSSSCLFFYCCYSSSSFRSRYFLRLLSFNSWSTLGLTRGLLKYESFCFWTFESLVK